MKHTERVARQSCIARHIDFIKLEGENGAKKATKHNIADFFICKVYSHNAIYTNE